jgi:hypothetical protein
VDWVCKRKVVTALTSSRAEANLYSWKHECWNMGQEFLTQEPLYRYHYIKASLMRLLLLERHLITGTHRMASKIIQFPLSKAG